tara:strand:+ start:162 stop:365 length:204 start_codon:yes stop_codon:yes gene_type:complete
MVRIFETIGEYEVDKSMYCGFKYVGENKWIKNNDNEFPFSMRIITKKDNEKCAFTYNLTKCPFTNSN